MYDGRVRMNLMDYNPNDYWTDDDNEEYLTGILVDVCSRYFVMFSNEGEERKVETDSVDEFMKVLSLVRDVVDEDIVYYVDPVVGTKNAR